MVTSGTVVPKDPVITSSGIETLEEDRTRPDQKVDVSRGFTGEDGTNILPFRKSDVDRDTSVGEIMGPTGSRDALLDTDRWTVGASFVPRSPRSSDYVRIMRAHFVNPILEALQKVQSHARSSSMAVYIDQTLHMIRQMEDHLPDDPLLEVLFAFYDALAFRNQWSYYEADQYAKAREVVRLASQKQPLQPSAVEKAIMDLEDIGFNTTPYPLDMEEKEEEV